MASEAGVLPIPEERDRAEVAPAAGQDAAGRSGARAASSPTRRSRRSSPRSTPMRKWLKQTQLVLEDLPALHPRKPRDQHLAARSPAVLRLHAGRPAAPDGADGDHRPGSGRLDGHRHADLGALRQVEAALHLFQAELRAGDQPADRPDPRGAGDVARVLHRTAAEPVRPRRPRARRSASKCASRSSPTRTWRRSARSATSRSSSTPHARHHLSGRAGRGRHEGRAREPVRARRGGRAQPATTSSSCPTARPARTAFRSRRCSRPRRCIII